MISIPNPIKNLFNTDGIRKNIRVSFPNGEHDDLTNADIEFESVSLTESLSSQPIIKFGLCESPCLEFTCHGIPNIKGMTIKVTIEIDVSSLTAEEIAEYGETSEDVDFPFYSVPYGIYKVKKCVRSGDTDQRKVTAYGKTINSKRDFVMPDNLEYLRTGWRSSDTISFTDKMLIAYFMPELAETVADETVNDAENSYERRKLYGGTHGDTVLTNYPDHNIINTEIRIDNTISYRTNNWDNVILDASCVVNGDKCVVIRPCVRGTNQQKALKTTQSVSNDGIYTVEYIDDDINSNYINDIIAVLRENEITDSETVNTITNTIKEIRKNCFAMYYDGSHTGEIDPYYPTQDPPFNCMGYGRGTRRYYDKYSITGSSNETEIIENNCIKYAWLEQRRGLEQKLLRLDSFNSQNRQVRFLDYRETYSDTTSGDIRTISTYSTGYYTINRFYICGFTIHIGDVGASINYNSGWKYNNPTGLAHTKDTFTYTGNSVYTFNRNISKSISTYRQTNTYDPQYQYPESTNYSYLTITDYFVSEAQINEFIDNFLKPNYTNVITSYLELQGKFGMIDRETGYYKIVDLTDHLMLYPSEDIYPAQDQYPRGTDAAVYRSQYRSVEYDDAPTKHYDRIECTWTDSNNTEHYQYYDIVDHDAADYDPDDYQTYSLTDNYFIKNKYYTTSEIDDILETLGEKIKDFQYYPCNIDMRGLPYLETGDGISVVTRDSGFTTYILRRVLKGINILEDNIEAQ